MRDRPAPQAPTLPLFVASDLAMSRADELHELRVRIPVELHGRLLSLKVLRGKSLAETVSLALDHYFAERAREAAKADAETGANPALASA